MFALSAAGCAETGKSEDEYATSLCDAWEEAADNGEALAKRELAYCFWNGVGIEPDLKMAEALLRESAGLGDPTAMYDLGTLLLFEDSNSENDSEGKQFLEQAMENGYGEQVISLGCFIGAD